MGVIASLHAWVTKIKSEMMVSKLRTKFKIGTEKQDRTKGMHIQSTDIPRKSFSDLLSMCSTAENHVFIQGPWLSVCSWLTVSPMLLYKPKKLTN